MSRDLLRLSFTGQNLIGFGLHLVLIACWALVWIIT